MNNEYEIGEIVLAQETEGGEKEVAIYLAYIPGAEYPYVCTYEIDNYLDNETFQTLTYKNIEKITITEIEETEEEEITQEDIDTIIFCLLDLKQELKEKV